MDLSLSECRHFSRDCLHLSGGSRRQLSERSKLMRIRSGRAATIALKATPAAETAKVAGATKGSWGKTAPKAKGAGAGSEEEVRTKVYLSNSTSGFKIPVKTNMFESDKI